MEAVSLAGKSRMQGHADQNRRSGLQPTGSHATPISRSRRETTIIRGFPYHCCSFLILQGELIIIRLPKLAGCSWFYGDKNQRPLAECDYWFLIGQVSSFLARIHEKRCYCREITCACSDRIVSLSLTPKLFVFRHYMHPCNLQFAGAFLDQKIIPYEDYMSKEACCVTLSLQQHPPSHCATVFASLLGRNEVPPSFDDSVILVSPFSGSFISLQRILSIVYKFLDQISCAHYLTTYLPTSPSWVPWSSSPYNCYSDLGPSPSTMGLINSPNFNLNDDNGPLSNRIAISMMIVSLLAMVLRFAARKLVRQSFFLDDWLIVVAVAFAWATCIIEIIGNSSTVIYLRRSHSKLIFLAVQKAEFGRHIQFSTPSTIIIFLKSLYAVQIMYPPGIAAMKLSVLLFYHRIFHIPSAKTPLIALGAITITWLISMVTI